MAEFFEDAFLALLVWRWWLVSAMAITLGAATLVWRFAQASASARARMPVRRQVTPNVPPYGELS